MQKIVLLLILAISLSACVVDKEKKTAKQKEAAVAMDLDEIIKRGKIRVVTDYNSTNYFVYRGRPLGYQLELLQALSNTLGLKLEIVVSNDVEQNFESLLKGDIDLIATNLTITRDRSHQVAFTEPHCVTHQVLVQQKSTGDDKPSKATELIRNQIDLGGKTIYVQENSAYVSRLKSLGNEIGDSIHIVEIPDYEVEQLIALVANGEIPYTVCDENLARINLNFYDNIDIETAVSFPQKIAWAVRPSAKNLKDLVDNWLINFKKTNQYKRIYRKYFINKRSTHLVNANFHSIKGGVVSDYDAIIKEESAKYNWDWRLIAALIYQESRFLPEVESWAGAVGLMQLMPQTAESFGVEEITSPKDNIQGGLKFLIWLDKRFADKISDPKERLKFVLAAYNVGPGHVEDAMRLAEKNNKNPYIWEDNVDYYLLNKSKPSFYNDPVVKYGYCRGEEPFHYVSDILERYTHYKNVLAD
ncbi:transglycosylase SLT domain-containing protein [Carboxylicivirga taeanensis]|uniref:transglycosylase SLT domain-containing protein n=1 Tax=Carboxylicivirga taeanensis TaxID=1416875 RepID=UPI003F6DB0EC